MKIVMVGNTDFCIYNYRFELALKLLELGHEVIVLSPNGDYVDKMISAGCKFVEIKVDAHGTNPISDLKLKNCFIKIFKQEKPDFVFGYTIKPNIYGAWACRKLHIPFIANITGLGPLVENKGIVQKITLMLYKKAFKDIKKVFCQNEDNKKFFVEHNIAVDKIDVLPGSGVNLDRFKYIGYPSDNTVKFVFISRIRKDKGIDQFIDAAKVIKNEFPNTEFHICGKCDNEYEWVNNESSVICHGMVKKVEEVLKDMHCLIFPSYYAEGLANVLLESCATGRPIMTTDRAGCKEVVDDGINGYIIKAKDSNDIVIKIRKFLSLSYDDKKQMGLNARIKVENEFDRNIIIEKYLEQIM